MSDETFRDSPDELKQLEEMLNNSQNRLSKNRVVDKPIDTSGVKVSDIVFDEAAMKKDGTLHDEVKTTKRGAVRSIDISNIKLNPNSNAIDKEEHIKRALYSNKSDFAGVAVQSGYAFTVLPLVKADAMQLLYTSKPVVDYRQSVYDVVYSKIHSFSIGKRMSKKEWMELTTLEDFESILYAIYCATFPTQGRITMECDHYDCGHEFDFEINNASMVKISDPKISKRLIEVSKVTTVDEMKKYTLINKMDSKILPDCGIIFTLRTPSLQDHIDILKTVPMDILEQNNHSLTDSLYIDKVYVPGENEQYDVVTERQEILRIINNLSIDDSSDLRNLITDRVALNRVMYTIKNVKCPKCGRPINETAVSIEELLFTYLYEKFRG